MKKNGFTLIEVVVSIVIAVLIGVAIASTCLIATSNATKTRTVNFAINEMQNAQKLFINTNLIKSGEINYDELIDNFANYYNNELEVNKQENGLKLKVYFNNNYEIKVNAYNCLSFNFNYKEDYVIMGAKLLQKDNTLYSNENIFSRLVIV